MTANVRKNSRHSIKALLRDLTYSPSTLLLLFPPGLHHSPHREDHCGNISSAPQRDPPPPWLLSPACRCILMGSCSLLAPSCTSLWESPAPPASLLCLEPVSWSLLKIHFTERIKCCVITAPITTSVNANLSIACSRVTRSEVTFTTSRACTSLTTKAVYPLA